MDADLDLPCISVYCTTDDLLPKPTRNARRKLTDAAAASAGGVRLAGQHPGLSEALRLYEPLRGSSHGDEVGRREHDHAVQLACELVAREVALKNAVLRTIDQPPERPRLSITAEPPSLLEDDELAGHTQCVGDELGAGCSRLDVRVDVAGECEVERAVREWQRRHVGLDELNGGRTGSRKLEHLGALVDGDDAAAQQEGQVASAAADVENSSWRQARHEPLDRLALDFVNGLPRRRVVLGGSASVVLLHRSDRRQISDYASARR
jgi:hypothetical protein